MIVDTLNPFSKKVTNDALQHAKEVFPEEAAGLVVAGQYCPATNTAERPEEDFEISKEEVAKAYKTGHLQGVWHSHTQGQNSPSMNDMKHQIGMGLPWGIHVLEAGAQGPNFVNTITLGDHTLKAPLEGRQWVSGVFDCVNLIRSYFLQEKKLLIPDFARDVEWWDGSSGSPFETLLPEYEKQFHVLPPEVPLELDDIVVMALRSSHPNHFGVLTEDQIVLHHMIGSLSAKRPFVTLQATLTHVLRLKS